MEESKLSPEAELLLRNYISEKLAYWAKVFGIANVAALAALFYYVTSYVTDKAVDNAVSIIDKKAITSVNDINKKLIEMFEKFGSTNTQIKEMKNDINAARKETVEIQKTSLALIQKNKDINVDISDLGKSNEAITSKTKRLEERANDISKELDRVDRTIKIIKEVGIKKIEDILNLIKHTPDANETLKTIKSSERRINALLTDFKMIRDSMEKKVSVGDKIKLVSVKYRGVLEVTAGPGGIRRAGFTPENMAMDVIHYQDKKLINKNDENQQWKIKFLK